MLIQKLLES